MKKYVLLGFIALVMLVLSVAPVMADTPSATIDVNGTVAQTLSISNNAASFDFGAFVQGPNQHDVGTLTITSAFVPNWTVTATMSDTFGYMRRVDNAYLATPLKEYNYLATTPAWQNVQGMTFKGSSSTTMVETLQQTVLITDLPGNYKTTITYTITAA